MQRHFGGRSHNGVMPIVNPRARVMPRMPNPRRQFNIEPSPIHIPVVPKPHIKDIVTPIIPKAPVLTHTPYVLPAQVAIAIPKPTPDIPRKICDCVISNNFTRKNVKEFTTNIWATHKSYINVTKLFKEKDVIVSAVITGIKGDRTYIVGLSKSYDTDPIDVLIPKCAIPSINSYENQANFEVKSNTCLVVKCSNENTAVPLTLTIVYIPSAQA